MTAPPIRSSEELWELVASLRDDLRAAGETAGAQRLHAAMTISAHPGEVWPETRQVLHDLLRERPGGLDADAAQRAAEYLASWP